MTSTTADTTYNGWKNYETWAVNLHITNDQASDTYWREAAADQLRRANMYPPSWGSVSDAARVYLAEVLKDELSEAAPDLGGTLYADLLNAALSEVDWFEIAGSLLSDAEGYERE